MPPRLLPPGLRVRAARRKLYGPMGCLGCWCRASRGNVWDRATDTLLPPFFWLGIALRACYAMSGTDAGYAATRSATILLHFGVSGTDVGYAATRRRNLGRVR
eukprot:3747133-Rhodomonas_salina.7